MFEDRTPDKVYAELFEAVQTGCIFDDSKTFVDAIPKTEPTLILNSFRENRRTAGFDLRSFVISNFDLPKSAEAAAVPDSKRPVRQHIELLWDVLTRAADTENPDSSLISLPNPYIVPGGRFREIYYWDSYFTMLGLAEAGRFDAIEDMVDNFAFLIDEIGFIPNGNRTYFCSRSQPPFFVLMVELLAAVRNDRTIVRKYLPQLRLEYEYWMDGSSTLDEDGGFKRHVIRIGDAFLNRYWDDFDSPRPESYAEDREHAARTDRDEWELYRNIRAACESGWDFSSRWLSNSHSLESIRTTDILPLDLNALLCRLETVLAESYREIGDTALGHFFGDRATQRQALLQTLFFDEEKGFFVDLSRPELEPTGIESLAAAYLLFLDFASPDQADRVVKRIQDHFLAPGGWVTTLQSSEQQWDRPNGWAPLQWIVFNGFCNYGYTDEADAGAKRWVENNLDVYSQTGRLLEKYDVEHIGALATGGEYAVQDGFGWTNAVLLKFMNHLGLQ
jgi:alpha,alpha-trehalase